MSDRAYSHECDCDTCIAHCLAHPLVRWERMQIYAAREYERARFEAQHFQATRRGYGFAITAQSVARGYYELAVRASEACP